jgi:hypothetical protein
MVLCRTDSAELQRGRKAELARRFRPSTDFQILDL